MQSCLLLRFFLFFLNLSGSERVSVLNINVFLFVFITFSCWTETTVTQTTPNIWMLGAPYTLL